MRILFVSSGLGAQYGGAPISEASLASHLRDHCDVTLLCNRQRFDPNFLKSFDFENAHAFNPLDVYRASQGGTSEIQGYFEGIDLLHLNAHWQWENYFFAKIALARGIPYVLHPRGICHVTARKNWRKRAFNLLLGNFIVRSAAKIILLSEYESAQLAPYRVAADKLVVIPNGISPPPPSASSTGKGNYFLYYGRLEARKNLLFLLDAFARYRARGGRATLQCMGPSERGYDRALDQRARELKITDAFGRLPASYGDEKWKIIRDSLAVVYPSLDEPFGRVPFEALAAGVLPVVPEQSGSAEYLRPLLPECLYPQGDVERLSDVLGKIESRKVQGLEKARAWVTHELNWDRISGRVAELYSSILPSDSLPLTVVGR